MAAPFSSLFSCSNNEAHTWLHRSLFMLLVHSGTRRITVPAARILQGHWFQQAGKLVSELYRLARRYVHGKTISWVARSSISSVCAVDRRPSCRMMAAACSSRTREDHIVINDTMTTPNNLQPSKDGAVSARWWTLLPPTSCGGARAKRFLLNFCIFSLRCNHYSRLGLYRREILSADDVCIPTKHQPRL